MLLKLSQNISKGKYYLILKNALFKNVIDIQLNSTEIIRIYKVWSSNFILSDLRFFKVSLIWCMMQEKKIIYDKWHPEYSQQIILKANRKINSFMFDEFLSK